MQTLMQILANIFFKPSDVGICKSEQKYIIVSFSDKYWTKRRQPDENYTAVLLTKVEQKTFKSDHHLTKVGANIKNSVLFFI